MSATKSNRPGPRTSPTVVVKLREERRPAMVAATAPTGSEEFWNGVLAKFPGARVNRTFAAAGAEPLARLVRDANEAARKRGGLQAPNLNTFYSVTPPAGTTPRQLRDFIAGSNRELVEKAYVSEAVIPTKITPWDDPKFESQGYVRGRRGDKRGVYANWAWALPGGDGAGVGVTVVDFGFLLGHEDLKGTSVGMTAGVDVATFKVPANVTAQVPGYIDHGTACLGEILGQDNALGIVGIAPKAKGSVVSIATGAPSLDAKGKITAPTDGPGTLIKGIMAMQPGDIMSISLGLTNDYPLEVEDAYFWAIWVGSMTGRIICTAAGNGKLDLDKYTDAAGRFILNPAKPKDFRDSGAIMVGAATGTLPHDCIDHPKWWGSNFGKRVNCFAWGEYVTTTSAASTSAYQNEFNGTSAATPIIAGAAALTQGLVKASCKKTLFAWDMRDVLSSAKTTVPSHDYASKPIGRMPNMFLIDKHYVKPSCKITGVYGSPGQAQLFLDPGHGGHVQTGRSTAYGGRGPRGTTEKEIALALAQRIQARFGGRAALSRDGDFNLSLRDRLEAAQRFGAPAFVSLHAHPGPRSIGPEVWVYGDRGQAGGGPDPFALGLARSIRDEIAAVDDRPVRIREGRIGVLHPRYHEDGVAACLVEAGPLGDDDGESRLSDPSRLDALGAAIARGVDHYIGGEADAESSDELAFATGDVPVDPEDTDGPGTRASGLAELDESGAPYEDDRIGGRQGSNGVHHESY